ncbi:MAG: protein translocase subunit SecF [Moritella sp.]|uniref:protein translocase subunit SecF n=1 Tax=unclassified Moritella TaxID=2637987 RepID=UPI0001568AA1|nr:MULTISPECIES: protein translocase subunit SecF [unclassified Moritella]EDM68217.1 protein export protein SecF [Moritella sp. PE36]MBL1418633.1 protein translocase subunit SecF [Moritella sp.]
MFEIIKTKRTIHFMKMTKPAFILSALLVILSISSIAIKGINWGLDFTGGTVIEVGYDKPADLEIIRPLLSAEGFDDAVIQHFGSSRDVLIRLAPREGLDNEHLGSQVITALQGYDKSVEMRRIEFVGPNVGDELAEQGGLALLAALICILLYVGVRFEWRLASGAVLALAHDVIITLGIFSVLQIEFDLTILAALLTVIGYSLNDTIVVFDRIRENFRRMRIDDAVEIMDVSLTQTLSRTLITSGTTLMVLVSLFLKGGALIHGFALALLIGVVVGTYSSIYVASALALRLGVCRETMLPPVVEKEGADQDPMM